MIEVDYIINKTFEKRFVDVEKSIELSTRLGAIEGYCWYNAIAALVVEDIIGLYVEGWQVYIKKGDNETGVWNHGWIESNGIIIDPYPVTDWNNTLFYYFPAVKYTRRETNLLLGTEKYPPYADDFTSPYHNNYMISQVRARRLYGELNGINYGENFWKNTN